MARTDRTEGDQNLSKRGSSAGAFFWDSDRTTVSEQLKLYLFHKPWCISSVLPKECRYSVLYKWHLIICIIVGEVLRVFLLQKKEFQYCNTLVLGLAEEYSEGFLFLKQS